MTAALNVLGAGVAVLDTLNPAYQLTAGEGAVDALEHVDDVVALTSAFGSAVGNYARLCRFPSNARIKSFQVFTDAAPDSNSTQTVAFDFGVAFSDRPDYQDGTPQGYSGLIPTTTGVGGGTTTAGTTTSFSSYSSPNKLFGTLTLAGNNKAIPLTELTFNGAVPATYSIVQLTQTPIVEVFNFLDGRQAALESLGWFDIYVYVSHVAATAAACNLYAKLTYTT